MEGNVWMQLFAQVASFLSSLLGSLTDPKKQESPISSSNVPANDANTSSTSKIIPTNLLKVVRNPKWATKDGLFGEMSFNGKALGFTMERTAVAIPEGTYRGYKRVSAHFHMRVVGIDVPNRTDIECHPANLVVQIRGCVAVGESIDNGALDNSRTAFDAMMEAVPEEFTVCVSSL